MIYCKDVAHPYCYGRGTFCIDIHKITIAVVQLQVHPISTECFVKFLLSVSLCSSPGKNVLMVSICDRLLSMCFVNTREPKFIFQSPRSLVRMFVSMISRPSSKLGHVKLYTRSQVHITAKAC